MKRFWRSFRSHRRRVRRLPFVRRVLGQRLKRHGFPGDLGMMQEKTFVGRSHKTRFLPALAVIGALFAVAMMSAVRASSRKAANPSSLRRQFSDRGQEQGSQEPNQGRKESKARPSSALFLTVEKVPLPVVVQCATQAVEGQGWIVLPSKKGKNQLRTFRNVGVDELRRIADTKRGDARIYWVRGRADLILSFSPAADERTRIDLRARILGWGETSLPLLRPSNLWTLPSSGALEGDVLAALKAHCGPATNSGRTETEPP